MNMISTNVISRTETISSVFQVASSHWRPNSMMHKLDLPGPLPAQPAVRALLMSNHLRLDAGVSLEDADVCATASRDKGRRAGPQLGVIA